MLHRLAIGLAAGLMAVVGARADELPKAHFKAIGLNGPTVASSVDELPFWRETLPKASNGAITADITPLDQMGVDDKTMLRLLKLGVIGLRRHGHLEDGRRRPAFRGLRSRGAHSRRRQGAGRPCDAYRAVIDRQMQKNWNVKLLAFGGNPPQVFWCRDLIGGLDDLKGKKIRVFNNTMRDLSRRSRRDLGQHGLCGGRAGAQQRRGRLRRDRQPLRAIPPGWAEVTSRFNPMSLGWSINVVAVNLATWNRPCRSDARPSCSSSFKLYEDKMWATLKQGDKRRPTLQHQQAALHAGKSSPASPSSR